MDKIKEVLTSEAVGLTEDEVDAMELRYQDLLFGKTIRGIDISDKHVEMIIRQMLKKVIIIEPGDSEFSAGQGVNLRKLTAINTKLLMEGKTPAKFGPLLQGISKASVETESFLSAASFQETTKVLTDAAVNGKVDTLFGIKENVIIGKLIPAGTGMGRYRNWFKV